MKKYLAALFLALAPLSFFSIASAHELIPQKLQEYIASHPEATPAEISAYADVNTPEFAARFPDKEKLFSLLRDQNTNFFDNFYDFAKLGINHILSGQDHILFVISLLLAVSQLRQIIKLTGSFTIAHSITLVLAGSGILTLPSRVVEPLIAISIAYVALLTAFRDSVAQHPFFSKLSGERVGAVFFFGLFHGLGFAGLLQELRIPAERFASSLFAFNVGIELGQLSIVALVLPFLYIAQDTAWYPKARTYLSVYIGAIGLFWAAQRIIGF